MGGSFDAIRRLDTNGKRGNEDGSETLLSSLYICSLEDLSWRSQGPGLVHHSYFQSRGHHALGSSRLSRTLSSISWGPNTIERRVRILRQAGKAPHEYE
jgi:hypothetical protein